MKIDIKPTPEMIVKLIDEYCTSQVCPIECVFDKAGICTEDHALNNYADKYEYYIKKNGAVDDEE